VVLLRLAAVGCWDDYAVLLWCPSYHCACVCVCFARRWCITETAFKIAVQRRRRVCRLHHCWCYWHICAAWVPTAFIMPANSVFEIDHFCSFSPFFSITRELLNVYGQNFHVYEFRWCCIQRPNVDAKWKLLRPSFLLAIVLSVLFCLHRCSAIWCQVILCGVKAL